MSAFYLIEREDKRVILTPDEPKPHKETLLDVIHADTWIEANLTAQLNEGIYRDPGHGWFRR